MLKVFPNPASDFITISLPYNETVDVMIFSLQGQLVHIFNIAVNGSNINIQHLNPGVYALVIRLNNKVLGRQLIMKW